MEMNEEKTRQVRLLGIGMGMSGTLTGEAKEAIRESDCVIGAKRMLGCMSLEGKAVYSAYMPEEIRDIVTSHPEYRNIAVLYSGDIGFYSGARELYQCLNGVCDVRGIPGISSVAYLAARLQVPWEDARLVSIHGRSQPYIHILARHRKCFLLFGGNGQEEEFCRKLKDYGLDSLKIWIGRFLSYEEESIVYRSGADIQPEDLRGLAVLYIENSSPAALCDGQIRDEAFIRGKVPMTKEEVRAVSIAKLGISGDSVFYDVGAGTGSVAVTVASMYERTRVYAIERNAEGVSLIRQNQKKFCVDQLEVIEGTAPEILHGLEPPTHVFIGGSSGNLEGILRCVREKNPDVRVVLNAITLETLREVLDAEEKGLIRDAQIMQAGFARSRKLADYHMMTGQNPIYIISSR